MKLLAYLDCDEFECIKKYVNITGFSEERINLKINVIKEKYKNPPPFSGNSYCQKFKTIEISTALELIIVVGLNDAMRLSTTIKEKLASLEI